LGINVNLVRDEFPAPLEEMATSVLIEIGKKSNRAQLVSDLLWGIETWYERLVDHGAEPILDVFRRAAAPTLEKRVRIVAEPPCEGLVIGVSPAGALLVREDN